MNILIYTQYFWPESFRINEIALALKSEGHDVEIVTGKPNYPEGDFFEGYTSFGIQYEDWNGIHINRLPIIRRFKNSGLCLALNYLSFIISGLVFAPFVLRKKKLDVIFVYGVSPIFQVIPASYLGFVRRIPVCLWVQDLWPESAQATGYVRSKIALKFIEYLVRFSYKHVDSILVQSKSFISYVRKLAPEKRIEYYPNSVDKAFYAPAPLAQGLPKIPSLDSGFTVLFAGNVGTAQSVETILEAGANLVEFPLIKIVILGSGSKLEWLREQINTKKLKNIFLEGRFPMETMPHIMRQASVLLVSLTAEPIFSLTVPNKIQAYLAVGKPIIASLNGEGARIVEEAKAGLTVPAEDSESLASAILHLYRSPPSNLEQMGSNGRLFFKSNYDEDKLTKQLIKHLEDLVREH